MTSPRARRAVELLVTEAISARVDGRYAAALEIAGRAVAGAEHLGDTALLVRALQAEATPLRMLGDQPAALARYTRVIGLAQDGSLADVLDGTTAETVFQAHFGWVESARLDGRMELRKLFEVLDAADRWITDTGHPEWRYGILYLRARLHAQLNEPAEALMAAQAALAAYRPGAPGCTLATIRTHLGRTLRDAGRPGEAEPLYQAVFDDPDSDAFDLQLGWHGLARCALDSGRPDDAVAHATRAVEIAEGLGDDAVLPPLEALFDAHRARRDLDAATQAAIRAVVIARRIGGHYRPFFALRNATDIALDRDEHDAARALLDELDVHAAVLDATYDSTQFSNDLARCRRRLDGG